VSTTETLTVKIRIVGRAYEIQSWRARLSLFGLAPLRSGDLTAIRVSLDCGKGGPTTATVRI
jgi:hypothetical protein